MDIYTGLRIGRELPADFDEEVPFMMHHLEQFFSRQSLQPIFNTDSMFIFGGSFFHFL